MEKTVNFQLNKPEPADPLRLEDFNTNSDKIDAALAAVPKLRLGSYTGDGEESQNIDLGAKPKWVFVWRLGGNSIFGTYQCSWGIATEQGGTMLQSMKALELTENGFRVFCASSGNYDVNTNKADLVFGYLSLM